MLTEFGSESAETEQWFRHALKKRINTFFVLLDEHSKVVGLSNSQYLTLEGGDQEFAKSSILAVWHICVAKKLRGQGLAKHLQYAMLRHAYDIAKRCRHLFVGACGETVETAEHVFNKIHWRRVYYCDQVGDMHELPYVCPPVEYNAKTGKFVGPAVPEHLMLGMLDDRGRVKKDLLLNIIWTLYVEYLGTRADYTSYNAYGRAKRYLHSMLAEIENELSGSGDQLKLLTREERDDTRAKLGTLGHRIFEIKAAR
jgi:GNAT superfamily N-acetyltransferase